MFTHLTVSPKIVLRCRRIIAAMTMSLAIPSSLPAQTFVEVAAPFPQHVGGAAAWGDYDNDGDLDLAIAGDTTSTSSGFFSSIYRNDGHDTFNDIEADFPGIIYGVATWADYDSDMDLDVLLTGQVPYGQLLSRLYRNNQGVFEHDLESVLPGLITSFTAWSDYDGDSDPDLFGGGRDSSYK